MTTMSPAPGSPAPGSPAPTNRLTYDDDLFLRSQRVLGIPLVNQTVWRFPEPLDTDRLRTLHRRLATGPLGRRIVHSPVPGARDRWVRSSTSRPLGVRTTPVADDQVMAWADEAARTPLDPAHGPTWALAAATTASGEGLLSYLTSHVAADGGMHLGAIAAAATGERGPRLPVDDLATAQTRWRDDLRDAAGQWRDAARGLVAWRRLQRDPAPPMQAQQSTDTPAAPPQPDDAVPHDPATVVVDCPAEQWHAAATAAGGTANTLFVAICTEVLLASGRVEAGRPVRVALPVSLRGEGDLRSNASAGVSVAVPTAYVDGVGRVTDLAAVRAASRAEFAALTAGTRRDDLAPLKPLMQLMPDALARRVADHAASPLALASNLGRLDPVVAAPTGVPCSSAMMRSVPQGVTRGALRTRRGGVTSWWDEHDGTATLVVVGLDPDRFPDAGTLRTWVADAYARWGLLPRFW